MLLPGVSGSLFQLVIGTYSTYITAIKEVNLTVLALYIAGAIVGLAFMARLIGALFRTHFKMTQAVIGGLVIGSVVIIWPWQVGMAGHLLGIAIAGAAAAVPVLVHKAGARD